MRGQGTIYARGESLWIYWYSGGDRRESVAKLVGKDAGRTTWEDAVKALKRRLEQKTAARVRGSILTPRQERVTVTELADAYLAQKLVEGVKRPRGFTQAVHSVKAWWGPRQAAKLTTEALWGDVKAKLEEGYARGTVKTHLYQLHAILVHAGARLASVPTMPALSVPLTRKGTWSADELARFCAVAKPWVADVARFGYLTGWRISEVLGLTWERVDLRRGLLFLDETKTDDPRVRPVEPAMVELIGRRTEVRRLGCALVFHLNGLPITMDAFYRAWKGGQAAAGLSGKLFHDFRRTAYDRFLLHDPNIFAAMNAIGHKSMTSARRYARPNVEQMRAMLARVDAGEAQRAARKGTR